MKAALVLGAGRSGQAAADLLTKEGLSIDVYSDKSSQKEQSRIIKLLEGGFYSSAIKSPGFPSSHPMITKLHSYSITIQSELELGIDRVRRNNKTIPIIACTGTNGKSTVCSMIYYLLSQRIDRVALCGNIGTPVCSVVDQSPEVLVIEASSYQLQDSAPIQPDIAIYTSFSRDHLKVHKTMKSYALAKLRLTLGSKAEIIASVPFLQEIQLQLENQIEYNEFLNLVENSAKPSIDLGDATALSHFPSFDQLNAKLAIDASNRLLFNTKNSTPAPFVLANLADFSRLPHRLEVISDNGTTRIINDSKSTNLSCLMLALQEQREPVTLICGGEPKDEPFSKLALFSSKVALALGVGKGGQLMAEQNPDLPFKLFHDLDQALQYLKIHPPSTDILFSPGCASFDQFSNYVERGNFFKTEMQKLIQLWKP